MTYLTLPSLENHGSFIEITGATLNEALQLVKEFDERVKASRKLGTPTSQIPDSVQTFNLLQELEEFDFEEIVDELKESNIPRHRGLRAVIIDTDSDTIAVGTTVVYNRNWAMLGVEDSSIAETILDFGF